jgi:phosphocarrier protein
MAKRRVKVSTEVGIQARPATVFVGTAAESRTDVTVAKPGGDPHDAKSILQVLTLDVRSGDEIVIAGTTRRSSTGSSPSSPKTPTSVPPTSRTSTSSRPAGGLQPRRA